MMTVELHEQIRNLFHNEHLSGRQIALKLEISRQTVAKALAQAKAPTYTLQKDRTAPVLGPFKQRVDQLLAGNKLMPKKQRYTAHKIYEALRAEGYTGSEASINTYAVNWRKQNHAPKLFLPLSFEPGQDGQVDWGEAVAIIGGVTQTVNVFVMFLNYSHRRFVMAFPSQKQEAFFEGHVKAFEHFGGIPQRLSYDNLSTAVKIMNQGAGRVRKENPAFVAFRSYYLYQSNFCTPGKGSDKGGVEASVGFSRRNFFVPLPKAASFEDLNAQLCQKCLEDDLRTVTGQPLPIQQMWLQERTFLRPLPLHQFDCCVTRQVTLTPYSQVIFETNRYSVPVELARAQLVLKAYPFRVVILDEQKIIATHQRCYAKQQDIFDPLHYLPLLEQRPGAFEYAKPLKHWRKEWPPVYHELLKLLQERPSQSNGVKEFVRILGFHQEYSASIIEAAIKQALAYGCPHFDGVQQCLHQLTQPPQPTNLLDLSNQQELAQVGQQSVNLGCYDELLEREAIGC